MNIFFLDIDPRRCAEMHNDKHCVKMILEYAQLLSTAHRVLDGSPTTTLSDSGRKRQTYLIGDDRDNHLYRATHINHPSAVWVRQSDKNYDWLFVMWHELMTEYTHRYGKVHASERLIKPLSRRPYKIPNGKFTDPTPAMPDEYKVPGNSLASYHNYYLGAKRIMSRWTEREMPQWFAEGINKLYEEDCYIFHDKRGRIVSTSTVNI